MLEVLKIKLIHHRRRTQDDLPRAAALKVGNDLLQPLAVSAVDHFIAAIGTHIIHAIADHPDRGREGQHITLHVRGKMGSR